MAEHLILLNHFQMVPRRNFCIIIKTKEPELSNYLAKKIFYILDVFAERKYAGNQLAVFRYGNNYSDREMLQIAREMHFSETTFIMSDLPRDGGYDVRIFTPGEEVPFAGHPTLGTAHIIRSEILRENVDQINLNLKVGQIPVTFQQNSQSETIAWMKQIEPVFGELHLASTFAPILGLSPDDFDPRFPIEEVSTGLPHFIVPLRNLEALKKIKVDRDKYFALVEKTWPKLIMVFCNEAHGPQPNISVRMFADYLGVPEDPATGSGSGCLAAYLARHRYWGEAKIDVRSEQGYEIGRPSLLFLKAEDRDGHIDISVGGKSVIVARGEFE
jgi:trans-2,3-dihydro-3-hydroxyanthranilate isomerase